MRDDSGSVQDQDVTLDPASNITAITHGANPANSQSFGYDTLDRLIDEAGANGSKDYGANGNCLSRIYNNGCLAQSRS